MRAAYGNLREPPAVALALTLAPVVAGVKVLGRQLCTHLAASFCRPSWCASPQHSSRERGWWHENEVEICRRGHEQWAGGARSSSVLRYGGCAAATQERAKTSTRHLVASSGLHFAAATVLLAAGCGDAAWYADRGEPRPARQILCQTLQRVRVRALGKSRGAGANKLANAVQAALRHGTRLLYDVADSPRSCE